MGTSSGTLKLAGGKVSDVSNYIVLTVASENPRGAITDGLWIVSHVMVNGTRKDCEYCTMYMYTVKVIEAIERCVD